jgi:hypothetical protein
MASLIPSKAPSLPLATVEYEARYQDQLSNVLRLYFNTIDNALGEIIRTLDYAGPFNTLYANTVQATTVNATNVNTTNLASLFATIQQLQATTIAAANIQGGNGVFNDLTGSNVNANLFTGAGYQINFPHMGATDSTDQYADADDDPTIVDWDTVEESREITLASDAFTVNKSGVYKVDYSLQFTNTDSATHDVVVWVKINNVDVARSATTFSIPTSSYVRACSTVMLECQSGDDLEIYWATDKAYSTTGPVNGVYMEYVAPQTTPYAHPAIPSAVITITYVSALVPARTQITPIGVSGYGRIGAPTIVIT